MTYFLISFPSSAMRLSDEEFARAVVDSHAVTDEAVVAGVWVFGGGIDADARAMLVDESGEEAASGAAGIRDIDGGFTVLDLPDWDAAVLWASKFARACRCPQELRAFGEDRRL